MLSSVPSLSCPKRKPSEELECPICYIEYDPELRLPLLLHCGHVMCQPCIRGWQLKIVDFTCPICVERINQFTCNELPVESGLLELACEERDLGILLSNKELGFPMETAKCQICEQKMLPHVSIRQTGLACDQCYRSVNRGLDIRERAYCFCPTCAIIFCYNCLCINGPSVS